MRGWVIPSSRARAAGSVNTMSPRRWRSMAPPAPSTSGQAAAMSAWAGRPGATPSRASASASTTGTPRSANIRATVDLPVPMPPVSPRTLRPRITASDATLDGRDPRTPLWIRPRRRRRHLRGGGARSGRDARAGPAGDRHLRPLQRRQVDAAQPAGGSQRAGAHLKDPGADPGPGDVLAAPRSRRAALRAAAHRSARVRLRPGVALRAADLAAAHRGLHTGPVLAGAVRDSDRLAAGRGGRGAPALRVAGDRARAGADRAHQGRQALGDRARPLARALPQDLRRPGAHHDFGRDRRGGAGVVGGHLRGGGGRRRWLASWRFDLRATGGRGALMAVSKAQSAFQIEPMRLGDLDAVVEIERLSFRSPWSGQIFLEEMARDWAHVDVVREAARGTVLGFGNYWLVADEVHLLNVATDPVARRAGHASRMLAHIIEFGRRHACRVVTLEVRRSNTAAARLYRRFGFRVVGVRPNYYAEDQEDAIVMLLDLE